MRINLDLHPSGEVTLQINNDLFHGMYGDGKIEWSPEGTPELDPEYAEYVETFLGLMVS